MTARCRALHSALGGMPEVDNANQLIDSACKRSEPVCSAPGPMATPALAAMAKISFISGGVARNIGMS